jgi:translation initiation factor IF-3
VIGKYYKTNQFIRAEKLRVIDEEGKQIGVISLEEALKLAKDSENDLVEIAPMAKPPVAKIINFKKFLYIENKKEQKAKKGIKGGDIKGIRLTPFMAQGDLDVRIKKAEEFLKDGNKVRAAVRFTKRQLGKKQFGFEVLNKFSQSLSLAGQLESEPKWLGKELIATLAPIKGQAIKEENEKEQNQNEEINQHPVQDNENR